MSSSGGSRQPPDRSNNNAKGSGKQRNKNSPRRNAPSASPRATAAANRTASGPVTASPSANPRCNPPLGSPHWTHGAPTDSKSFNPPTQASFPCSIPPAQAAFFNTQSHYPEPASHLTSVRAASPQNTPAPPNVNLHSVHPNQQDLWAVMYQHQIVQQRQDDLRRLQQQEQQERRQQCLQQLHMHLMHPQHPPLTNQPNQLPLSPSQLSMMAGPSPGPAPYAHPFASPHPGPPPQGHSGNQFANSSTANPNPQFQAGTFPPHVHPLDSSAPPSNPQGSVGPLPDPQQFRNALLHDFLSQPTHQHPSPPGPPSFHPPSQFLTGPHVSPAPAPLHPHTPSLSSVQPLPPDSFYPVPHALPPLEPPDSLSPSPSAYSTSSVPMSVVTPGSQQGPRAAPGFFSFGGVSSFPSTMSLDSTNASATIDGSTSGSNSSLSIATSLSTLSIPALTPVSTPGPVPLVSPSDTPSKQRKRPVSGDVKPEPTEHVEKKKPGQTVRIRTDANRSTELSVTVAIRGNNVAVHRFTVSVESDPVQFRVHCLNVGEEKARIIVAASPEYSHSHNISAYHRMLLDGLREKLRQAGARPEVTVHEYASAEEALRASDLSYRAEFMPQAQQQPNPVIVRSTRFTLTTYKTSSATS